MNPKVSEYINSLQRWQEEAKALRSIMLSTGLKEELKWKHPCYTSEGKNIAIIQDFKDYCTVLFLKGSLLDDPQHLLVKLTENVQVERQIRFTSFIEVTKREAYLKRLVLSAVQVEKSGVKPKLKETEDYPFPEELIQMMESDKEFKAAFTKLTPGRQRGYLLHYSQAKQASTRTSRIQNTVLRIKDGFGLNDCICGRSKRMPNCDGSHKGL